MTHFICSRAVQTVKYVLQWQSSIVSLCWTFVSTDKTCILCHPVYGLSYRYT